MRKIFIFILTFALVIPMFNLLESAQNAESIESTVPDISTVTSTPVIYTDPPVTLDLPITEEYITEVSEEDTKIETTLLEQGYLRDDIPLTYEEQDYLYAACTEFDVEYPLMLALIEKETDFRNISGDNGNSTGYCQIQIRWCKDLMDEIGAEDLWNPYDNFRTACALISQYTEKYGSVENALSAYNTGKPGKTNYADTVLANMKKWE